MHNILLCKTKLFIVANLKLNQITQKKKVWDFVYYQHKTQILNHIEGFQLLITNN